jgi:hypothetical protein
MPTVEERTAMLNSLLRGELSAVETYEQALVQIANEPGAEDLQRIAEEHRQAAEVLRRHIVERGGKPAADSGAWGTVVRTVEGAAKLLGNSSALQVLRSGEEHGVNSYESALQDQNLDDECKQLIRSTLLPQTQAHLPVLDRLLSGEKPELVTAPRVPPR